MRKIVISSRDDYFFYPLPLRFTCETHATMKKNILTLLSCLSLSLSQAQRPADALPTYYAALELAQTAQAKSS